VSARFYQALWKYRIRRVRGLGIPGLLPVVPLLELALVPFKSFDLSFAVLNPSSSGAI
jgi:hypothetical protein